MKMTTKEFISKFKSKYLWFNLAAIFGVVALLGFSLKVGLDIYTRHGEAIPVPNLIHKNINDAQHILDNLGLRIEVSDTGYVRTLPPDCILEQTPPPGETVKNGHVIYVIINSPRKPKLTIPDVIDNSSLREAMAKLSAMGFRLGQPQFVPGEQDWVYGITVNGHSVTAGDKVSVDDVLVIQVGNGQRDAADSVDFVDPEQGDDGLDIIEDDGTAGDNDEFEEVPEAETRKKEK